MEANEAMKAMAREIAARHLDGCGGPAWANPSADIRAGLKDDIGLVQAALAAIIETQAGMVELRDVMADARACIIDHLQYMKEPESARIIKRIDTALRTGEHYALTGGGRG